MSIQFLQNFLFLKRLCPLSWFCIFVWWCEFIHCPSTESTMTWKRSPWACQWAVVLIILIMVRRSILIVGVTFPWVGDPRLCKSEEASWTLASCTHCSSLLTSGTVGSSALGSLCLTSCMMDCTLEPWARKVLYALSCSYQGFYYNNRTRNQVSQHIHECWRQWVLCSASLVYVPVSHQHQTARSV